MSVTLLLHGGRLKLDDTRNDSYFRRLTSELENGDELLFVGFARRDEIERQETYDIEKNLILSQTNKDIRIVYATVENFVTQLTSAKAVHIPGGDSPYLVDIIQKYPKFLEGLDGKLVGGSSAGAVLFSSIYWNCQEMSIREGLNVLAAAIVVHYGSEEYNATDDKLESFKEKAGDLELITIEECAWIERAID